MAFDQPHEGAQWLLTLGVSEGEILDLTGCGLDVAALVTDLLLAGIPASTNADDERHPMQVVRRVPPEAVRGVGYRVVRIREWIDWARASAMPSRC